jgi:hypothetical protein
MPILHEELTQKINFGPKPEHRRRIFTNDRKKNRAS